MKDKDFNATPQPREREAQRRQVTKGSKAPFLILCAFAVLGHIIVTSHEDYGLRWQSAAATPLFECGPSFQSGVALRFPPQSKKDLVAAPRAMPLR